MLLWLDDLHRYLASGLDTQQARVLLTNAQLVIVATMLRERLRSFTQSDFKPGATDLLTDDALIARIDIADSPSWSIGDGADPADNSVARAALAAAGRTGVGLGEYLAAYAELRNRYKNAGPWAKALIDCVADWSRTGMPSALPEPLARDLWHDHYLSAARARKWALKTDGDRDSTYLRAVQEATQAALGSTALLERTRDGLSPSEVALLERQSVAVPEEMWTAAAREALTAGENPAQAESVALQAGRAGQFQIAESLWASLTDREPQAVFNLGLARHMQGDLAGAAAAGSWRSTPGTPSTRRRRRSASGAAQGAGVIRWGRRRGAQLTVDSGHAEHAPAAALKLGMLREQQGDLAGASAAYHLAVDSGHAKHAPAAALFLGVLRKEQGDLAGAAAAYQLAIDSGRADARRRRWRASSGCCGRSRVIGGGGGGLRAGGRLRARRGRAAGGARPRAAAQGAG